MAVKIALCLFTFDCFYAIHFVDDVYRGGTRTRTVWNGMERNGAPAESRSSMHGKVETYTHIDNSGGRNVRTRTHQVGKTTKLHRSEQMNDGTKQWN